MRRRDFITLIGGAATAWPLAVHAQQSDRMRRVGALSAFTENDPEDQLRRTAFREGLQQLGWIEGRNIRVESRWFAGEPARARAMAKELVDLQPDLIVAGSTPGLAAVAQETRRIPIVFVAVSDPVGQGFVTSLARPGGNATGFTYFEFSVIGKVLEALKQIAPGVVRIGLVFNPDTRSNLAFVPAIEAVAPSFSVEVIQAPVRNAAEIEAAITGIARAPDGGLIFVPDPFTIVHRELIVSLATRHRLPAAYTLRLFATAGGLMSYSADAPDLWRRAASYVDRILKGAQPADLPVQQPTKFELVINLKTAMALGLTVPSSLLARADEVIE